jgi:hypothetical protein
VAELTGQLERVGLRAAWHRLLVRIGAKVPVKARPRIHVSAVRRIERGTQGYAPTPFRCPVEVVATRLGPARGDVSAATIDAYERRLNDESARFDSRVVDRWAWLRSKLHTVMLAVTAVIVMLVWVNSAPSPEASFSQHLGQFFDNVTGGAMTFFGVLFSERTYLALVPLTALGVVIWLTRRIKGKIYAAQARFWRRLFA